MVLCQAVRGTLQFIPVSLEYLHAAWLLQVGGSYGLCKHTLLFILGVKWHLPFRYCTDRRFPDLIVTHAQWLVSLHNTCDAGACVWRVYFEDFLVAAKLLSFK